MHDARLVQKVQAQKNLLQGLLQQCFVQRLLWKQIRKRVKLRPSGLKTKH